MKGWDILAGENFYPIMKDVTTSLRSFEASLSSPFAAFKVPNEARKVLLELSLFEELDLLRFFYVLNQRVRRIQDCSQ